MMSEVFQVLEFLALLKEAIPSNLLLYSLNTAMPEENSKQLKSKQSISTDARKKVFQFLMQVTYLGLGNNCHVL